MIYKYKIGQKVTVLDVFEEFYNNSNYNFVESISKYAGNLYEISKLDTSGGHPVYWLPALDEDISNPRFPFYEFELKVIHQKIDGASL